MQSQDIQVFEAIAAVWFLMTELLQLAKSRVWTPAGSTLDKGRELQIHLSSKHGMDFSQGAKIRAKAAQGENLEINLKTFLGRSSEQRETPVSEKPGKLEAPSRNDSTQPIQGSRKAGAAYGDKSHHFRDPLRCKEFHALPKGVPRCSSLHDCEDTRVKSHSWLQGALGLFPRALMKSRGYTEYPSQMCKPTHFISGSSKSLQGCILYEQFGIHLQRP